MPDYDPTKLHSYVSVHGALYNVWGTKGEFGTDGFEISSSPILESNPRDLQEGQPIELIQGEAVTHKAKLSSFKIRGTKEPVTLVLANIETC